MEVVTTVSVEEEVFMGTQQVAVGSIYSLSKRVSNHFRKYIYSVGVVTKHILWNAMVHPKMVGSWMLRASNKMKEKPYL